jgi:hypothetical protein
VVRLAGTTLDLVIAGVCIAVGTAAFASPPPGCGTTAVSVVAAETLRDQGAFQDALQAAQRIHVDDLPVACRVHVRALEAELLIALDRVPEARTRYASILDEVPGWRPSSAPSMESQRAIFEDVRADWVRSHAGPLRVSPTGVSLLSPATDVPSTTQPLLIQATQHGEISWRVQIEDPWIHVSRASGTTFGGRDTVVVSARSPEAEPPGTHRGRLRFEALPWSDVEVDVTWEIGHAGAILTAGRPHGRRVAVLAIGAAFIGTIVGLVAF